MNLDEVKNNFEYDVLIVGGGAAGLTAAVAAAEKGASVILLEKGSTLGGNAAIYGKEIPAVESPVQTRKRIVNILTKNCQDLGVKLLCDTMVKKILTGTKGEVRGIQPIKKEREEFTVTAKSVIIATGGYPANKKLIEKYSHYHPNFASAGLPYDGDGIALATQIGAATEGIGALALCGPNPERKYLSITIGGRTHELSLMVVAQEPYTLWVNKKGRRFVDEAIGYNHYAAAIPLSRQPEGLAYTIFDSEILKQMCTKGFIIGMAPRIEDWWIQRDGNLVGLESELDRLADEGVVKISDSWNEIANWIGAVPAVLKATVDEYNVVCDRGHEPIFVKERRYLLPLRTPPYYAIRCKLSILHTMGGIKINEHMQALDKEGDPIPGFYAAGMETGGWENE